MGGGRTEILRELSINETSLTVSMSPFSYRENAGIHTFSDDWIFEGKLSEKYKRLKRYIY